MSPTDLDLATFSFNVSRTFPRVPWPSSVSKLPNPSSIKIVSSLIFFFEVLCVTSDKPSASAKEAVKVSPPESVSTSLLEPVCKSSIIKSSPFSPPPLYLVSIFNLYL